MGNSVGQGIHHLHRHDIIVIFGIIILLRGFCRGGNQYSRSGTAADLHGKPLQLLMQTRQEFCRHTGVNQNRLHRVTNRRTGAFGVDGDLHRHFQIGILVHKQVTVSRPRFNDGNGSVFHHALDQSLSASGNQHVHVSAHGHQNLGAFPLGGFNQLHPVRIQITVLQCPFDQSDDGGIGMDGFLSAAKNHRVARLQAESGGIHRHVRTCLVDHGDHAKGDPHAGNFQSRRTGPRLSLPYGILQLHQVSEGLTDPFDSFFIQRQSIQHGFGNTVVLRLLQILLVFQDQRLALLLQQLGNAQKHAVFRFRICQSQTCRRFLGVHTQQLDFFP